MRNWIAKDSDGISWDLNALSTQKWLDGHGPGIESAIVFVKERAMNFFKDKKDSEARMLRDLADEMQKLIKEAKLKAEKHKKEFPYELGENYDD